MTMLHLNAFLMGVGHHEAAWRLPESDPFAQTDVEHFKHLARIAERGGSTRCSSPTAPCCGTASGGGRPAPSNRPCCSPPWPGRPSTSG
ncbi:hypothetical protein ACFQZ4_02930 [Catellatospora coxensis]